MMTLLWKSVLALIPLLLVYVDAGHPMESSPRPKRAIPINLNSQSVTIWPGGTVQYCWEDEATKNLFEDYLVDAQNLWHVAGLPEQFKFEEIPHDECMRNRRDSLLIQSGPGYLEYATTVGKYVGPPGELVQGPLAIFNTRRDPSQGRQGSNTVTEKIAHELGHVWGLFHEHQDPYFWGPNEPLLRIHCASIDGFTEASRDLDQIADIYGPDGICVSRLAAFEHGFLTATHLLPMPELSYIQHQPRPAQGEDVDWDSIMLYNTWTGARSEGEGNRPGVLYRTEFSGIDHYNNNRIMVKRAPSQKDVEALVQLYEAGEGRAFPRLYHDPRSEYHNAFERIRNYLICDGPSGFRNGNQ